MGEETSVILCTIEKTNQLINKLIELSQKGRQGAETAQQEVIESIGTIVVDELHMIGDESRGYLLEVMLSKIKFLQATSKHQIQLIAMSATLPNLRELAIWLDACLYVTDFRPVEVKEYLKIGLDMVPCGTPGAQDLKTPLAKLPGHRALIPGANSKIPGDRLQIFPLIEETLRDNGSLLVFCQSKNQCEQYCSQFMEHIVKILVKEGDSQPRKVKFMEVITDYLEGLSVAFLQYFLEQGQATVGFHHSGLSSEERESIELLFKKGFIKVIFCTSTLAAGVNLPAKRVIISSIK